MALMALTLVASSASVAQETPPKHVSHCTDWKAWHNLQPGTTPPTLHVTANCQFPTSGYSVELVPAKKKPQNAKALALRMVVHKPEGMALQVISDVPLQYATETKDDYATVLIAPDKVRVKVEKVY